MEIKKIITHPFGNRMITEILFNTEGVGHEYETTAYVFCVAVDRINKSIKNLEVISIFDKNTKPCTCGVKITTPKLFTPKDTIALANKLLELGRGIENTVRSDKFNDEGLGVFNLSELSENILDIICESYGIDKNNTVGKPTDDDPVKDETEKEKPIRSIKELQDEIRNSIDNFLNPVDHPIKDEESKNEEVKPEGYIKVDGGDLQTFEGGAKRTDKSGKGDPMLVDENVISALLIYRRDVLCDGLEIYPCIIDNAFQIKPPSNMDNLLLEEMRSYVKDLCEFILNVMILVYEDDLMYTSDDFNTIRIDIHPETVVDAISQSLLDLFVHYEYGAKMYGVDNWKHGIPNESFYRSAIRHLFQFIKGMEDEKHGVACIWNLMGLLYNYLEYIDGHFDDDDIDDDEYDDCYDVIEDDEDDDDDQ